MIVAPFEYSLIGEIEKRVKKTRPPMVWQETNGRSTCRTKILALFMADENDPVTLNTAKDTPFVLKMDHPSTFKVETVERMDKKMISNICWILLPLLIPLKPIKFIFTRIFLTFLCLKY